jgi:hypothetical protein
VWGGGKRSEDLRALTAPCEGVARAVAHENFVRAKIFNFRDFGIKFKWFKFLDFVSIDILLLAWQILILQFQKKIWVALNCFL